MTRADVAVDHAVETEEFLDPAAAGFAPGESSKGIACGFEDGRGKPLDIFAAHQAAGDSVGDLLAHPAAVGGDHRQAAGHGFQRGIRTSCRLGHQDENVKILEELL